MHVTYLSQKAIALPFELSPTHIRNIGLDSLAGVICILLSGVYHIVNKFPISISNVIYPDKVPWRRPRQHPFQSFVLILLLFTMYLVSGLLTPIIVTTLNIVAVFVPLTVPMQR